MSSRKRYFQYLAAQRFYEEATGDYGFYQEDAYEFTECELRMEAAFRCWLREIDVQQCPQMLPLDAALRGKADAWDWVYGLRMVGMARHQHVHTVQHHRRRMRGLPQHAAILLHVRRLGGAPHVKRAPHIARPKCTHVARSVQ